MSTTPRTRRSQRGYVLPFVLILTAAIVATSTAVSMVTLVEASSSTQDVNAINAFAIAYGGAQRAYRALDESASAATLKTNVATLLNGAASVNLGTSTVYTFHNLNDAANGVSPTRPGGNGTSYSVGRGFFRLFLSDDINDTVVDTDPEPDSNATVTIKVYARYMNAEAMVEANYMSTQFPGSGAAFSACFANPNADMIYNSRQGPGLPFFSFRFDGAYLLDPTKHVPAVSFNVDPYRMDGYQQEYSHCSHHRHHHGHCGNEFTYNKYLWFLNPDTDNEWGNYVAPFHLSRYPLPGTTAIDEGDFGPLTPPVIEYKKRPFGLEEVISVYSSQSGSWYDPVGPGRTISTSSSLKDDTVGYRLPMIAFRNNPRQVETSERNTSNYDYLQDTKAARGIYACYADKPVQAEAVVKCVSGNDPGGLGNWSNSDLVSSGVAWNYVQTIVRKCKGSGSGAYCDAGCPVGAAPGTKPYCFLENAAKCLILPADVRRSFNTPATAGDTGGDEADYKDGGAIANRHLGPAKTGVAATQHSWYGGGYPRVKIFNWDPGVGQFQALNTCATASSPPLTDTSSCGVAFSYYTDMQRREAFALRALMQEGVCVDYEGVIRVKFCKPNNMLDANGLDCLTDVAAWLPMGCKDGWSARAADYFSQFPAGVPAVFSPIDTPCGCPVGVTPCSQNASPTVPHYEVCNSGLVPPYSDCVNSVGRVCGGTGARALSWMVAQTGAVRNSIRAGNWGDFTTCADECYINDGGLHRSVCINLDPFHVAKYGGAQSPTWINGERGSAHMISRFDLSDDGPLGKCNPAARTCKIPGNDNMPSYGNGAYPAGTWDGVGEWMGPFSHHPRVISTGGGEIQRPPFSRTMSNRDSWTPVTIPDTSFCPEAGDNPELFDIMLSMVDTADAEITYSSLPTPPILPTGASVIADPDLTYGGATCKYDDTNLGLTDAGWYVSDCDDANWQVVAIKNSSPVGGHLLCGCGMLIIKPSGVGKVILNTNNKSEGIVWRGVVFMMSGGNDTTISFEERGSGTKSLYVDGAFILLSEKMAVKRFYMDMILDQSNLTASTRPGVSVYVRYNDLAVAAALAIMKKPYSAFRMLY